MYPLLNPASVNNNIPRGVDGKPDTIALDAAHDDTDSRVSKRETLSNFAPKNQHGITPLRRP
jgi:hypothetical protein